MNARDLWLRVRALVAPRRVERELDEELAFHIEMETERQLAAGLSPADARGRARSRFGPAAIVADQCRDVRGIAFIETCVRDLSHAFRSFRRTPTVAATVIGTMAIGLGLSAAIFTIFNAFVFRSDGVSDPGSLYRYRDPRRRASGARSCCGSTSRSVARAASSPTSSPGESIWKRASTDAWPRTSSSRATSFRCSASVRRSGVR